MCSMNTCKEMGRCIIFFIDKPTRTLGWFQFSMHVYDLRRRQNVHLPLPNNCIC